MDNKVFMQKAIELSIDNVKSGKGGPFGAIVVKDGKIIAQGANSVTTNNDPTAHAEVMAIREACKVLGTFQLDDCDIYTSCDPCPMCLGAIYWARPNKVYYANTKKDAADINFGVNKIIIKIYISGIFFSIGVIHFIWSGPINSA